MVKAMITLLAMAVGFLEVEENAELAEAIDAFKAVGDGVKATDVEAVKLNDIVTQLKADAKAKAEAEKADAKAKAEAEKADADAEQAEAKVGEPAHYMHIRMIGNLFYHKDDNYKKGFTTAKECALEYNK